MAQIGAGECRRLVGKVVVVAGASTGIGRATALRLGREGASLVVGSPAPEQALIDSLVEEIRSAGGTAVGQAFDATDEASLRALAQRAASDFGGLDAFHANFADLQAVIQDGNALETTDELFDRTFEVNLKGMLRATRIAIPLMLERGGGAMIYTSSAAAIKGQDRYTCYSMAKAGINALVRQVATSWGRQNIRANAVMPGFVLTPEKVPPPEFIDSMLAVVQSPRLGTPEDIAAMVALLVSRDGDWINGQAIAVDGGWT